MKEKKTAGINFVSRKSVKKEINTLEDNIFSKIEKNISEKYIDLFDRRFIRDISATAFSCLTIPLYLECTSLAASPSYQDQLTMIYDFRELLNEPYDRKLKYMKNIMIYKNSFVKARTLVDSYEHFQITGTVSDVFIECLLTVQKEIYTNLLSPQNESFSPQKVEHILCYAREITLAIIDAVTSVVEEQIYRLFGREAEEFVENNQLINTPNVPWCGLK